MVTVRTLLYLVDMQMYTFVKIQLQSKTPYSWVTC